MPICPNSHQSETSDWCEVCGMRMTPSAHPPRPAGPGPTPSPSSPSSSFSSSASAASTPPTSPSPPGGFVSEPTQAVELCPQCGTPREGLALFCEECRYNFGTRAATIVPGGQRPGTAGAAVPPGGGPAVAAPPDFPPYQRYDSHLSRPSRVNRPAEPLPAESVTPAPGSGDFLLDPPSGPVAPMGPVGPVAPMGPVGPDPVVSAAATSAQGPVAPPTVVPGGPGRGTAWVAVIGADREYFTAMMSRSGPEARGLYFPAYSPEVRLPLTGGQVTIGRRRHSTGEAPGIDLSRAPEDPGVSHQHAVLVQQPDGGWAVVDQNSTNGTTVNLAEDPIRPYTPVPLDDGDRVHVGAWTTITLRRA